MKTCFYRVINRCKKKLCAKVDCGVYDDGKCEESYVGYEIPDINTSINGIEKIIKTENNIK